MVLDGHRAGRDPDHPLALGEVGKCGVAISSLQEALAGIGRCYPPFPTYTGAFVGGVPTLPVFEGEMQARCLGADVRAWDDAGRELVDEVGELVGVHVIPRPVEDLEKVFPMLRPKA